MRLSIGAICVIFATFIANMAFANDCAKLLNNIYDFRATTNSAARASSFRTWYCSHEFESETASRSLGSELGIPLKGIPVEFGFDESRESFSSWQSNFCSDTSSQEARQFSSSKVERTINPAVINAFNTCTSRSGLHFFLMTTGSEKRYVLGSKLTPTYDGQIAKIRSFETENIECNNFPTEIGVAGFRTICKRESENSGDIVMNANITTYGAHLKIPTIRKAVTVGAVVDRDWSLVSRYKANNHCQTMGALEDVTNTGDVQIGLGGTTIWPEIQRREAHFDVKIRIGNELQQARVVVVTPQSSQTVVLPGQRKFEISVQDVEECSTKFQIKNPR